LLSVDGTDAVIVRADPSKRSEVKQALLKLADAEEFKKQLPDGVIALVGTADGKAAVTVAVTGAAAQRLSAVDLAKAAVLALGGQGAGGRPDFAQGGAPEAARAEEGLAAIRAILQG
jgi:alanyl-tRNA synthetase